MKKGQMKKGGSKKTLIIMSLKLNEQFNWGESVVFSVNNISQLLSISAIKIRNGKENTTR